MSDLVAVRRASLPLAFLVQLAAIAFALLAIVLFRATEVGSVPWVWPLLFFGWMGAWCWSLGHPAAWVPTLHNCWRVPVLAWPWPRGVPTNCNLWWMPSRRLVARRGHIHWT